MILSIVVNLGSPSSDKARYNPARLIPVALAKSVMPRALAIRLSASLMSLPSPLSSQKQAANYSRQACSFSRSSPTPVAIEFTVFFIIYTVYYSRQKVKFENLSTIVYVFCRKKANFLKKFSKYFFFKINTLMPIPQNMRQL